MPDPSNGNGRVTMARLDERLKTVEKRVEQTATKDDINLLRSDLAAYCAEQQKVEERERLLEISIAGQNTWIGEHVKQHDRERGALRRENIGGSIGAAIVAIATMFGLRPS